MTPLACISNSLSPEEIRAGIDGLRLRAVALGRAVVRQLEARQRGGSPDPRPPAFAASRPEAA